MELSNQWLNPQAIPWGFVFKNPIISRPKGKLILISCMYPKKQLHSRLGIIEEKESYSIIGQIHLPSFDQKKLIDYTKLIEYKNNLIVTPIGGLLDLNNPYYNVEWNFNISHEEWRDILVQVSKLQIPIRPVGLTRDRRAIWFQHLNDKVFVDISREDSRLEQLDIVQEMLLNIALKDVQNACFHDFTK